MPASNSVMHSPLRQDVPSGVMRPDSDPPVNPEGVHPLEEFQKGSQGEAEENRVAEARFESQVTYSERHVGDRGETHGGPLSGILGIHLRASVETRHFTTVG